MDFNHLAHMALLTVLEALLFLFKVAVLCFYGTRLALWAKKTRVWPFGATQTPGGQGQPADTLQLLERNFHHELDVLGEIQTKYGDTPQYEGGQVKHAFMVAMNDALLGRSFARISGRIRKPEPPTQAEPGTAPPEPVRLDP